MNFKDFMLNKIEEGNQSINEVKFSAKNLEKVALLYGKIMGKQMGGVFKVFGTEDFKRKSGPGRGIRMMNESGEMLRFNWDKKLAKKAAYDLTSIDFWAKNNIDFQKPTRTITFGSELNVVQVLAKIVDALKTGTINEAELFIKEANLILEGTTPKERSDWLRAHSLPASDGRESAMRKQVNSKAPHLKDQLEIFLGQPEANSFEAGIKQAEKEFAGTPFADPETVFDDVEDLLEVIVSGRWKSMVVCGMGGIGKTFGITKGDRSLKALLGAPGDKWDIVTGVKASPQAWYKVLFGVRNKIMVWDEADSLLKNKDIIMAMKSTLDTDDNNNYASYMAGMKNMVGMSDDAIEQYCQDVEAHIEDGGVITTSPNPSEGQMQLPSKFSCRKGASIFISNMKADEIDQAIMSRSIFVDIYLAEQDVRKRIQSIALKKASAKGRTEEHVMETMSALAQGGGKEVEITYMTPEFARQSKQMTVRAYELAEAIRETGLTNWVRLAGLYA